METGPWTLPDTPSNVTAASVLSFVGLCYFLYSTVSYSQ